MMSKRRWWLPLLLGAVAAGGPVEAAWKAGVARVDVTPTESIWMAGFAARKKPSEGVRTKLWVKALALEDETGAKTVIVGSDLIGFRRDLADRIAQRCQKQFGVARARLLLNSSHTHSGPVFGAPSYYIALEPAQAEVVRRYTDGLVEKVVAVVGQSLGKLEPATLEFRYGLAGFAVNRRRDRQGMRALPAPVDHDVPVLAVRGASGELRAVMFGYACHNTTLGDYQINGDYAGYAQAAIESVYPGATAVFIEGCGADSNPLPRYHGTNPALTRYSVELAQMYGKILAAAVDLTLHEKMRPVTGPLNAALEPVDIPFQNPSREALDARAKGTDTLDRARAQRMLQLIEREGKLPPTYPYAVQVLQFGRGLKLIALAGEVVVDYALRLKAQHGWEDTWVAGYSNDVFGYIPSLRVLKEGGYETQGGVGGQFGAASEETIVEKVAALVKATEVN
ncbi:MAG TPA: neutral/alkaline non-lysosomal ceramidase N-terminal domain-containing protein [Bryobacteraceae bacterium]|nr:neutral/alkaline non-lysosomal ceramidase N-terminal domain-containing protein [Bryobacteraceae bacterium]